MKKHTLKINSDIHEIHEVEKFVENVCDYYNISNLYYGNIIVAITEAVENAILHGNSGNKDKKVYIQFETKNKGVLFTIEDQGNGFDYKNIPDATDIKLNPDKKGTGVFLMKTLSDSMEFQEQGRKVLLFFNIASITPDVYSNRLQKLNQYTKQETKILKK